MDMTGEQVPAKKILITYVLPGLIKGGGIERQFLLHMRAINTERFVVHVVTLFHLPERETVIAELPPHVVVHQLRFHFGFDLAGIFSLWRLLRRIKPDIVVSSMVAANTVTRCLRPLCGYKSIAREHNTYEDKTWWHRIRDHLSSYFSDRIVAVSNTVASFAATQAKIKQSKFLVIHNGVPIDEIKHFRETAQKQMQSLRQELGVQPETKILLNVARLKPQKNHRLLLEAWSVFKAQTQADVVLVIVGGGSERSALQQYIQHLSLEGSVKLMGFRADAFSFFALAHAFILTSDIEGFPNVALEAFGFGLPVLSTKVSGIDEILIHEENGFLLERDPVKIGSVIARVLTMESHEYDKISQAAQMTAQRFSVEAAVKKYESLYFELMNTI